jgi:hypothetical protein
MTKYLMCRECGEINAHKPYGERTLYCNSCRDGTLHLDSPQAAAKLRDTGGLVGWLVLFLLSEKADNEE